MKISLRRRHSPMVTNGALNHKIDYITIFQEILNLEGHQNWITGSRVTDILLNVWIFPIVQSGEANRWRVWYQLCLGLFKNYSHTSLHDENGPFPKKTGFVKYPTAHTFLIKVPKNTQFFGCNATFLSNHLKANGLGISEHPNFCSIAFQLKE